MTAPLLDLVAAFARRKQVALGPDWAVNAPQDLRLENPEALPTLCAELRWPISAAPKKPRAHDLPALAF